MLSFNRHNMADTELIQLRKEIERLNQLLDVVLFRNGQLEQQILAVEDFCRQANIEVYSYVKVGNEADSRSYALVQHKNGVNSSPDSLQNLNNGVTSSLSSVLLHDNGVDSPTLSDQLVQNGVNRRPDALQEKNIGVNYDFGNVSSGTDAPQPSPTHAANGEAATHSIQEFKLRDQLRALITNASRSGLQNTVKIMICLSENPKQSLKDLQKLTGLSEDGIVKRIMSMKKFGLIVRVRGQGLLLTRKAIEMITASRM